LKTRTLLLLALALSLLMLVGCVEATMKTTVNADGSGDVAITLSMPKEGYDQLKGMGGDPFQKPKADFRAAGYTVKDSTTGTSGVGFTASKHVSDITGDVIPKTITEAMKIAEQTSTTGAAPASGTLTKKAGLASDSWTASFTVPTSANQGASYTIQLVMPGTLISSNAQEKLDGGKTLQWKLEAGATTVIKAESEVSQTGRLIAMGVAALVGVGVVVFLVLFARRRKNGLPADKPAEGGAGSVDESAATTAPEPPAADSSGDDALSAVAPQVPLEPTVAAGGAVAASEPPAQDAAPAEEPATESDAGSSESSPASEGESQSESGGDSGGSGEGSSGDA
jgi:hypothetical protein